MLNTNSASTISIVSATSLSPKSLPKSPSKSEENIYIQSHHYSNSADSTGSNPLDQHKSFDSGIQNGSDSPKSDTSSEAHDAETTPIRPPIDPTQARRQAIHAFSNSFVDKTISQALNNLAPMAPVAPNLPSGPALPPPRVELLPLKNTKLEAEKNLFKNLTVLGAITSTLCASALAIGALGFFSIPVVGQIALGIALLSSVVSAGISAYKTAVVSNKMEAYHKTAIAQLPLKLAEFFYNEFSQEQYKDTYRIPLKKVAEGMPILEKEIQCLTDERQYHSDFASYLRDNQDLFKNVKTSDFKAVDDGKVLEVLNSQTNERVITTLSARSNTNSEFRGLIFQNSFSDYLKSNPEGNLYAFFEKKTPPLSDAQLLEDSLVIYGIGGLLYDFQIQIEEVYPDAPEARTIKNTPEFKAALALQVRALIALES